MVKSDLKTGMLAITRNNKSYLVLVERFNTKMGGYVGLMFCEIGGYSQEHYYNKDLTSTVDGKWDIMEIYESNSLTNPSNMLDLSIKDRKRLWKRTEQKETIKIGEITYDKSEFEQAVKNLKPINK